jgi:hypothetical protein
MQIEELQIDDTAHVTSVEPCPAIAAGNGSVVTARFITRQVDQIATVKVLGPNGQIEALTGTTVHPIWSVDRQDWVPMDELREGESLLAAGGEAVVLAVTIHDRSTRVYNIEVHGEHVYEVGNISLLVHNVCAGYNDSMRDAIRWLNARGFDSSQAIPYASKFSDRLNGLKMGNIGYRIEHDLRSGAHINVFAGREIGPHFTFSGNANDVNAILRQLFGG